MKFVVQSVLYNVESKFKGDFKSNMFNLEPKDWIWGWFSNLAIYACLWESAIKLNFWVVIKSIFMNKIGTTFVSLLGPILELWYYAIGC